MSEDVQFDTCSTCGHVYRPGMEESVSGHRVATGHAPTPAHEDRPDLSRLLIVAARRIGELEDVVDGLDGLAISWEQFTTAEDRPGLLRAARMLRDYLRRPPIHAQDEEASDG